MWALFIPNKVKIFGWKAFNDLLPCAENLVKRGVNCEGWWCGFCREVVESLGMDFGPVPLRDVFEWTVLYGRSCAALRSVVLMGFCYLLQLSHPQRTWRFLY